MRVSGGVDLGNQLALAIARPQFDGAPADHGVGIGLRQGRGGELPGRAADGAKQRPFGIGGDSAGLPRFFSLHIVSSWSTNRTQAELRSVAFEMREPESRVAA